MIERIELNKLNKRFKKNKVLNDLTFVLDGGRSYGIVGKNGSGKSVLLNALIGFEKLDGGNISIVSKDTVKIGAAFDGTELFPYLSALENLRYLATFRNEIDEKGINEILEKNGAISFDTFCISTIQIVCHLYVLPRRTRRCALGHIRAAFFCI